MMAAAIFAAAPAGAQSVKAGIDAWQADDAAKAVAIWRPLAEKGDADAQFNLGQAYKLGRGVKLDLAQAQYHFERAARQGHSEAQTNLGMLLFQNGNRTAALRWLSSGADAGDPRAMLIYGTALFNGDGLPADRVRAYAMVSRAAAQGLAPAQSTLAEMDQLIPVAERQKGVAMALQWSKASGPAQGTSAPARISPAKGRSVVAKAAAKPASAKPTAKAATPSTPAVQGGWRIQLGAFSNRSGAETLFRRLAPGLQGKQPAYVAVGAMTRLQVGPFESRASATSACRTLAARGQPCFPVAAR